MVDSPTKEELMELRKKQGKDALLMYAHRGALRKLHRLGESKIDGIWPEDAVKHLYSVCRAHILLRHHFCHEKFEQAFF